MYKYHFCGLNIVSEILLPQIKSSAGAFGIKSDLTIALGQVPPSLGQSSYKLGDYEVEGQRCLLDVPHVARYLISSGDLITVDVNPGGDWDLVTLYLLGSALAAVLHQGSQLPLHASAVHTNKGCVAFLGHSGAGKSTLASALSLRGFALMADDVLVARRKDLEYEVLPGIPLRKLWPSAAAALGIDCDAQFEASEHQKLRVASQGLFWKHPDKLRQVYVLDWLEADHEDLQIERLDSFDAFRRLSDNIYRGELLGMKNNGATFLHFASTLIASGGVYGLRRPKDFRRLPSVCSALEAHFEST